MSNRPEDLPRVATKDSYDDLPELPTDAIEQLPLLALTEVSRNAIAARALDLYRAGSRDTFANWIRAERELREEARAQF